MKNTTRNLPNCKQCKIRQIGLFGELEAIHLDRARELRSSQASYTSGEYLYREGDKPNKAYTLFNGWVILFKNLEDGSRQILRFSLPGDLLCFKTNKTSMDHSAIALTDITLCTFPLDKFKETISKLPELSNALISISEVTQKRCYATLTTISKYTAEVKIAYLMLSLFVRMRSLASDDDNAIDFPITQEDIADALGLTSIHVNRVIQGLRKKGLINCDNKKLEIPDQEALAKISKVELQTLKELMYAV